MTVVRTLAGGLNGTFAAFGDGTGSQAGFNQPHGVAVDASGNTFVGDKLNHRVRKVTPGGGANMFHFRESITACTSLATMKSGRLWASESIPLKFFCGVCKTIYAVHCDNITCLVLRLCYPIAQWSLRWPEVAYQVFLMQLGL